MRAKIEIEFCRMSDADVDGGAGRNVAGLSRLFFLVGAADID